MLVCNTVRVFRQAGDGNTTLRQREKTYSIVFFGYLDIDHEVAPLAT